MTDRCNGVVLLADGKFGLIATLEEHALIVVPDGPFRLVLASDLTNTEQGAYLQKGFKEVAPPSSPRQSWLSVDWMNRDGLELLP